jgi:hypothetical protein
MKLRRFGFDAPQPALSNWVRFAKTMSRSRLSSPAARNYFAHSAPHLSFLLGRFRGSF